MKFIEIIINAILAIFTDGGSYTSAVIKTHTVPKMAKRNNPYLNRVTKRSVMTIGLNGIYRNQINSRLAKEGKDADYKPRAPWFAKVHDMVNGAIVKNAKVDDGLRYLFCCVTQSVPTYYLDGKVATDGEVTAIKCFTSDTDYGKYQGLDKEDELAVITIGIGNITEFRYGGEVLKFRDVTDAEKIAEQNALDMAKAERTKAKAKAKRELAKRELAKRESLILPTWNAEK